MSRNYIEKELLIYLLVFGTAATFGAVKGIKKLGSNRDNIDLVKEYNIIEDYDYGSVSLAQIVSYSDYSGLTVEVITQDGLKILTGLNSAELIKTDNYEIAYNMALEMSGGNDSSIVYYDEIRGLDTGIHSNGWNKKYLNYNYDYNYAITETKAGVCVRKIVSWKDWDEDDKVQIEFEDGSVILTDYAHTKLVSTLDSAPTSLYKYAVSLAGSEDRVYGDIDKDNQISCDYNHDLYDKEHTLTLNN